MEQSIELVSNPTGQNRLQGCLGLVGTSSLARLAIKVEFASTALVHKSLL